MLHINRSVSSNKVGGGGITKLLISSTLLTGDPSNISNINVFFLKNYNIYS